MRARGDLDVLHEPFMYHFYLNRSERLFPDFAPDPDHPQAYAEIRAMILDRADKKPIFFKDMAYYVLADLPADPDFMAQICHGFLLRDPAEAILSYQRRDPEFTQTELGFEAQYHLYQRLKEDGQDPVVMTADQLRSDPEATVKRYWDHAGLAFDARAFAWDDTVPEDWKSVAGWHADVLKHRSIQPQEDRRDAGADLAELGAPYTGYDRHHRPFFEALQEVAIRQAHQK